MKASARRPLPATFHRIWAAGGVSGLGDCIYLSALPLLALTMTYDPVILGAMEACALLPWLFFGLIGGALVDRWDRRRTMRLADLFRFALLAGVTGLITAGAADIYLLFAVAFARLIALRAGPLGAVFGGYLARVAGLRAPFLFGAVVLAAMVVVAARLTSNKRIAAELAAATRRAESATQEQTSQLATA